MSHVVVEMAELTRELQKLSKELGPVKTALGAIARRELTTPSPSAAATSLDRVAARVADVESKYRPLMQRLGALVERELPAAMHLTALLTTPTARLEADAQAHCSQVKEVNTEGSGNDNEKEDGVGGTTTTVSAFSEVCPHGMPYVVPPEDYIRYREEVRLRVEMVEYLIATGRLTTARAAAASYGLPLLWFPLLGADASGLNAATSPFLQHWNPSCGGDSSFSALPTTAAAPAANGSATSSSLRPRTGTVLAGHATNRMSPPASLLITPALPPQPGGAAALGTSSSVGSTPADSPGWPPATPMQLPAAATTTAAHFSHPRGPSPPRVATRAYLEDAVTPNSATPLALPLAEEPGTPPLRSSRASAAAAQPAVEPATPTPVVRHPPSTYSPALATSATPQEIRKHSVVCGVPSLVHRVIAAGLMFKDEYVERMILERLLMSGGSSESASDGDHSAAAKRGEPQSNSEDGQPSRSTTNTGAQHQQGQQTSYQALNPRRFSRLSMPNPASTSSEEGPMQFSRFLDSALLRGRSGAPTAAATERTRYSHLERSLYDQAVLKAVADVSKARVHTQSASLAFDETMMGVIEELLATALARRPAEKDAPREAATTAVAAGGSRIDRNGRYHDGRRADAEGNEGQSAGARRCTRDWATLTAPLTPDEMLAAEDHLSGSVLLIKRPTRYYCAYTGQTMDGGGEIGTHPLALPNGLVVSQEAVVTQLLASFLDADEQMRVVVVCPKTGNFVDPQDLRRIFVT